MQEINTPRIKTAIPPKENISEDFIVPFSFTVLISTSVCFKVLGLNYRLRDDGSRQGAIYCDLAHFSDDGGARGIASKPTQAKD